MKILLSSDFHSDFSRLTPLAKKFDLCICCGDIFDYHSIPDQNFKFPLPFYSIKGNKEHSGGVKLYNALEGFHNFFWLNEHLDTLEEQTGMRFYGIDHLPLPPTIPANLDVLISHQPAYGLADQCSDSYHAKMAPHCGKKAIRRLIDLYPPKFLVTGHVHHFQKERMGPTLAVTLPPALLEPIIMIKDKEIVQL